MVTQYFFSFSFFILKKKKTNRQNIQIHQPKKKKKRGKKIPQLLEQPYKFKRNVNEYSKNIDLKIIFRNILWKNDKVINFSYSFLYFS